MSEQQNHFENIPTGDLDIASIFGADAQTSDTNPFAATPAPAPEVEQPQPPAPAAESEQPATQPTAEAPAADDPLGAAFVQKQAEADKAAAQSLFEKPPVFAYGSAKDPITDPAMTFEELRIAKSADFPELGEGKRVSWSVEYGKVTKTITDPEGKTIKRSSGPRSSWTA